MAFNRRSARRNSPSPRLGIEGLEARAVLSGMPIDLVGLVNDGLSRLTGGRLPAIDAGYWATDVEATGFSVVLPSAVPNGLPVRALIMAVGADNRPASFTGDVTLSSTDGAAVLPETVSLSRGRAFVSVTFKTAGEQTLSLSSGMSATRSWLEGEGYSVVTAGPDDLADVDLWFTTTYDDNSADQDAAIRDWITDGGGVIAGGHAWWWAYSTWDDDPYHNHPGNQWLGVAGLTLSGDSVGGASSVAVSEPPSPMLHAGRALRAAGEHVAGDLLPNDDAVMAAESAGFAASVLPVDSEWFLEARALLARMPAVVPSATDPVEPATAPIDALVVRIGSALAQRLPID